MRFFRNFLNVNLFYKILCYSICLMGCVYQTYKISLLYFSYETTTNVVFTANDDHSTDPALTLCTVKRNIYGYDTKNVSIERQFELYNIYFKSCMVYTHRHHSIPCHQPGDGRE